MAWRRSKKWGESEPVTVLRIGHYVDGGPWRSSRIVDAGPHGLRVNGALIRRAQGSERAVVLEQLEPLDLAQAPDAERAKAHAAATALAETSRRENRRAARRLREELTALGVPTATALSGILAGEDPDECGPTSITLSGAEAIRVAQALARLRSIEEASDERLR